MTPIEEIKHPNQSSPQTTTNTTTTGWNLLSEIGQSNQSRAPTPTNNWNLNPLPAAYYNNFTNSMPPSQPQYVAAQDGIRHQATQYVIAPDNINHPAAHYFVGEDGIHRQAAFMPMPIQQDSSSSIFSVMESDHAFSFCPLPSENSGQPPSFWKGSNVTAHLQERERMHASMQERERMLTSTSNANNVNDDEKWEQSYGIGSFLQDEGELEEPYEKRHVDSVGTIGKLAIYFVALMC